MKTPKNVRLNLKYADPEFVEKANAILKDFVYELKKAHRPLSYIEKVSQGSIRSAGIQNHASGELKERYVSVLKEYDLTSAQFTNFFTHEEAMEEEGLSVIDNDSAIVIQVPSLNDEGLTIYIHPNATRQDLIDSWHAIKETLDFQFHSGSKRLRGPNNTELLWAIHKARLDGKKYKQITYEVNSNTLPFYRWKKGFRAEWNEADLKQYYSDYKDYVARRA